MKYCITTRKEGKLTHYYFDSLNIDDEIVVSNVKYRIKAIGVCIRQQPVTKEYYLDVRKDNIVCLRLTNKKESVLRMESFNFIKFKNDN